MLDPTKLPEDFKADIAANRGWDDCTDAERDGLIAKLDERRALDYYFAWHGLGGWTGTILRAVNTVQAAKVADDA